MFLKQLSVHGFKSFADRTTFEFDRGMTSVVGPNGCGKSNVLDAVRWVLGEQSPRMLRGAKMLDVVFSGSRTRKPANFAEVELTFDNTSAFLDLEQREVTVGRVLFANGDSEYRINGAACRLRDVRDLFLDTGVGVSAYSVIEQGRVDMMLRASPTERRELFEEAAGISRYQMRRAEAQRKLERTQSNLLRLNDVIEELERRLRSVKLAAGKARNFQEYDTRLRDLRSSYSLSEFHGHRLARAALESESRALEVLLAAQRAALVGQDEQAGQLERERQDLDDRIERAEAESRRVENEAGATQERDRQYRLRLDELEAGRERLLNEAASAGEQINSLLARLTDEGVALEALAQDEQAQVTDCRRLRERCEEQTVQWDRAREALERQKNEAFEQARAMTVLQNEQQNLRAQADRVAVQQKSLEHRRAEVEQLRESLQRDRGRLEGSVAELERAADELTARLRAHDSDLCQLDEQHQRVAKGLGVLKEQRSALVSRLNVLEDLDARREGVGAGARRVLTWRDEPGNPSGVIGLVADLLQVEDSRIQVIQPVLARFERCVVIEQAHRALLSLREHPDPERVDWIALDRVAAYEHGLRFHGAPGVLARAIDWVTCAAPYRALLEQLLGRAIIVDSTERALALAAEAPEGYAFVTLDGVVVEPGGRMSSGAGEAATGLIGRKAEIRAARAELDQVETALESAGRRQAELEQGLSDARVQRDGLMNNLAGVQKRHANARTEMTRAADESARAAREHDQLAAQSAELQRAHQELVSRAEELSTRLAEGSATRIQHEQRIDALGAELESSELALAEANQALTAARVEAGRTTERKSARSQAMQSLHEQRAVIESRNVRAREEAERAAERARGIHDELRQCEVRARELAAVGAERQQAVAELVSQRAALRKRVETCNVVIRRGHSQIEAVDAALRDSQVVLRETTVRMENLVTRIQEDLDLDLRELYRDYEPAAMDWTDVREEIETLRTKIARLGNVNMDALSELEEISPRHETLSAQRDDLLASIEQLERLIADLDIESTQRFNACFAEVRENFQALFRKLFGGGKADIILEDPERSLECGIEIVARPPGKEPQTLSLLSGGEKTMTAVALLFAVFKRKPSPFAILDEVDAALDESNIDRFNNVLLEFLEQSQFIVITHSKRTMQCADVLYGVTMEEPGVSKRVSVRLEDRVETPHVA